MTAAFQYRAQVRRHPRAAAEAGGGGRGRAEAGLKPGERRCDHPGCRRAATARAPKSRDMLDEHYWFCQPHAAEYNRSWNFFAGMTDEQIRAAQADESFDRRAADLDVQAGARLARGDGGAQLDASVLPRRRSASSAADTAPPRPSRPRYDNASSAGSSATRWPTSTSTPRPTPRRSARRYTELVKRCHPDANGGDRSAEHKLQRVIKAYPDAAEGQAGCSSSRRRFARTETAVCIAVHSG